MLTTPVREDGKIDVSLQPIGRRQTLDFAETLLEWIKAHDGHCPFNDKSDPDGIKREFQVSKKVFKKAVGDLYKKQRITISDKGLDLVKEGEAHLRFCHPERALSLPAHVFCAREYHR